MIGSQKFTHFTFILFESARTERRHVFGIFSHINQEFEINRMRIVKTRGISQINGGHEEERLQSQSAQVKKFTTNCVNNGVFTRPARLARFVRHV